jgi:hypothetical protein
MHLHILTATLSLITYGIAAESSNATANNWARFRCKNTIDAASPELIATHAKFYSQRALTHHGSPARQTSALYKRQTNIVIKTVAHLISASDSYSQKLLTSTMLQRQIATMNTAYKSSNISFSLINITQHTSSSWATGTDNTMKTTLRQGGYGVLNMYFVTNMTTGLLGQCSLPMKVGTNPSAASIASDACVIDGGSMPGASAGFARPGYDLGMTAVHEVGHWNGLFHPFEGYSCDAAAPGDYIADTPVQSTATSGCPVSPAKDSCPGAPGVDSIHNYMDYSLDGCYNQFTVEQGLRMQAIWAQYRQAYSGFI